MKALFYLQIIALLLSLPPGNTSHWERFIFPAPRISSVSRDTGMNRYSAVIIRKVGGNTQD